MRVLPTRRKVLSFAAAGGLALGLGLNAPARAADDIVIGASMPMTGVFAFAGIALGVAVGRSVPAPRPAVRVWQRARPPRPVVRRAGHPRSRTPGTAGPRAPKR